MSRYLVGRCQYCKAVHAAWSLAPGHASLDEPGTQKDIAESLKWWMAIQMIETDSPVVIQSCAKHCDVIKNDTHHTVGRKFFKLFDRYHILSFTLANWRSPIWYDLDPQGLKINNWFRVGHVQYWNSIGMFINLGPIALLWAIGRKKNDPID